MRRRFPRLAVPVALGISLALLLLALTAGPLFVFLRVRAFWRDLKIFGSALERTISGLAASTGAYLLGVMPPELMKATGVDLPLHRRDPHYFLLKPAKGLEVRFLDLAVLRRAELYGRGS